MPQGFGRTRTRSSKEAEAHRRDDLEPILEVAVSTLQDLQRKYPKANFGQDPETAVIGFEFQDMWITDPFISECGRFGVHPEYYGLETIDAIRLYSHNLPLEMCHVG